MATDNEYLAIIQGNLEDIVGILTNAYSALEGGDTEHEIDDDAAAFERAEDTSARGVIVVNAGANPAWIYENENLLMILPAGESWRSPTDGTGEYLVQTEPDSGETTTIYFTTLRK
jgi:hypothetical protein